MGADGRGKGVRQCNQEEEEKMHTLPQHRQEHPPYLRSTGGKSEGKNFYLACLAVLFVFSATTTTSIAAADDVSTTTSTVDADRTSSGFDYGDALTKSLLYFEAQRSGRLPHDHRVKWRGHSGLTDGLEQGVDLVGGYYDAGDHVKFGLPMAFTITMLSWGVIDYAAQLQEARELRHALAAIKWGADYFVKAHTKTNQLWAQVGDGHTDHYCWQRPEDMTTSRRAYRIDETHPGSDLAGETAAALAAASVAFRPGVGGVNDDDVDPGYADMLLRHARELFEFADKYRGRYDESVPGARHYYKSISGYNDELLWAALWLQKAETAAGNVGGARRYLDYVVENAFSMGGAGWAVAEFSWDIKYAGVQVLAAKLLLQGKHDDSHRDMLERYRSKADHYICSVMGRNTNGTNVRRTPAGLIYLRQWNNMQYVATATMLMTVYSDYLRASSSSSVVHCPGGDAGPDDLLEAARAQVDYVLGKNPVGISYLVGFGEKYPKRVHHRGASTVAHKESKGFIGCMQGYYDWYGRQKDNPNVLVGALVGGPDKEDVFRDVRGNFMQTEACTYNTAPLVGVFAKLNQVEKQREHQQIIKAAVVTESTLSASSSSLTPSLAVASI